MGVTGVGADGRGRRPRRANGRLANRASARAALRALRNHWLSNAHLPSTGRGTSILGDCNKSAGQTSGPSARSYGRSRDSYEFERQGMYLISVKCARVTRLPFVGQRNFEGALHASGMARENQGPVATHTSIAATLVFADATNPTKSCSDFPTLYR